VANHKRSSILLLHCRVGDDWYRLVDRLGSKTLADPKAKLATNYSARD
jgi:hypothetical protein